MHALGSFRLDPPPDAHERILVPLAADRRLVGVAREHAQLVGERHEAVHHRGPNLGEIAATDRVLEQGVAGEQDLVVDDERDHVVGVAGGREAAAEPAAREQGRNDRG